MGAPRRLAADESPLFDAADWRTGGQADGWTSESASARLICRERRSPAEDHSTAIVLVGRPVDFRAGRAAFNSRRVFLAAAGERNRSRRGLKEAAAVEQLAGQAAGCLFRALQPRLHRPLNGVRQLN